MNHQPDLDPAHLSQGSCKPCEGGVDPLTPEEIEPYKSAVPNWELQEVDGVQYIVRHSVRENFVEAVELITKIRDIAESEGHHPDIHLTNYKHLEIALTTHAIGGLSVNDFIVAAKIEELEAF